MKISDLFIRRMKEWIQSQKKPYTIEPLETTRHWNVLKLKQSDLNTVLVAKFYPFVANDEEDKKETSSSFRTEKKILKNLPEWWGLHFVDEIKPTKDFEYHIIIMNLVEGGDIPKLPENNFYKHWIVKQIEKQLRWLHDFGYCHNDLEWKNIVIDNKKKKATLIDFEKTVKVCDDISTQYELLAWYNMVKIRVLENKCEKK